LLSSVESAKTTMSFDLQPTLTGELIELRPLAREDWDDLFSVASDPLIWEQHPESDRYKEDVFKAFFREAMESGGAFVIMDTKSQRIIGSTRFHGYAPEKSEIEIGWTFLARNYWGGRYNRELKQLMLAHAFKFVENVVFYGGQRNLRSQKATEKIGGMRNGMVQKADHSGRLSLSVRYVIKKPKVD
jgi:RimJ/RimL family protein N-acetyltransferase